jgi:hypothetical protein
MESIIVLVRCPNGHVSFLRHHVDDAGVVTPSLKCPYACEWHVDAELEGWPP